MLVPVSRVGFTLLEVIVSLGLVTILLVALGAAVDFHYRVVRAARDQIEEAQLARSLLNKIAQDIRGAVAYDPVNFEELIPGLVTQAGGSDLDFTAASVGIDTSLLMGAEQTDTSLLSGNWTETTLPRPVPGLYGGSDWIEVDVSRLPRPDQLQSEYVFSADGVLVDRLSDVKTVAYFVLSPEETINYSFASRPGIVGFEQQGGLVRRELDRAVTYYASTTGELDSVNQELEPIAPEVELMEFAYFDGSDWYDSWDSAEQGSLPKAVEIRLYLRPKQSGSQSQEDVTGLLGTTASTATQTSSGLTASSSLSGLDLGLYHIYRMVVWLPAAHETGTLGARAGSAAQASGEQGQSEEEMGTEDEEQMGGEDESGIEDGGYSGASDQGGPGGRWGGRGSRDGSGGERGSGRGSRGGGDESGGRPPGGVGEGSGGRGGGPGGPPSGGQRPGGFTPPSGGRPSGPPAGGGSSGGPPGSGSFRGGGPPSGGSRAGGGP